MGFGDQRGTADRTPGRSYARRRDWDSRAGRGTRRTHWVQTPFSGPGTGWRVGGPCQRGSRRANLCSSRPAALSRVRGPSPLATTAVTGPSYPPTCRSPPAQDHLVCGLPSRAAPPAGPGSTVVTAPAAAERGSLPATKPRFPGAEGGPDGPRHQLPTPVPTTSSFLRPQHPRRGLGSTEGTRPAWHSARQWQVGSQP